MKKIIWIFPALFVIPLFAVTPYFWEVRTYDEFRRGKLANLSLTSDDQLILSPRFDMVFNTEQPLILSSVADSKGNVYLGTGHDGKIYKVDSAGKNQLVADLMELDVLGLAVDANDVLYAGTSPDGKVYKIAAGAPPQVFFNPGVKYIWSLAFDKQGRLLVATGDKGVIYRVNADGNGAPFYDTDETHIISMAVDNAGNVIAGGDPKGYIYRISPEGKAFVLYDSGMREVHAVSVAANGTIYAAVLSAQAAFPAPTSPSQGSQPVDSDSTISITIGAAAQNVEVVEPPPVVVEDSTPRAASNPPSIAGSTQSVVLEILPDGTVNTLWRSRDEMVYALIPYGDKVLFSTGTKGRIYSVDRAHKTTLMVESTEEQTTRLVAVGNRVYAASSNDGKLFSMGDALAASGTYDSTVRDTEAISSFGKLSWKMTPAGDRTGLVQLFTRSGNTSAPDKTWSDWAGVDAAGSAMSPKARFLQWRAVLKAAPDRSSPVLTSVSIPYLQQNFKPEVTSIDVLPSGVALVKQPNTTGVVAVNDQAAARANARLGQPIIRIPPRRVNQRGAQSFQWTATDKNQDILRYDLFYRGDSESSWKPLVKGVEDAFYTVDSDTLPDGTYVVRIVASDLASNPPEVALSGDMQTRAFPIDNTPPSVTLKQESLDARRVRVAIDAVDSTSTLNQAEVSTDTEDWRTVFPKDGITDSKSESFTYLSEPLSSGEHVIAFRIYDQNDNVGMGKLVVRIP